MKAAAEQPGFPPLHAVPAVLRGAHHLQQVPLHPAAARAGRGRGLGRLRLRDPPGPDAALPAVNRRVSGQSSVL